MRAKIEIEYDGRNKINELSPEDFARLREEAPELELPEAQPLTWNWSGTVAPLIDMTTTGALLVEMGIGFKIKRFSGAMRVRSDAQKCVNIQVSIPNLLLFAVDEVRVLEDQCTDILQSYLDEGWRILAVCPPPNQRRPDYILGRQAPRAE